MKFLPLSIYKEATEEPKARIRTQDANEISIPWSPFVFRTLSKWMEDYSWPDAIFITRKDKRWFNCSSVVNVGWLKKVDHASSSSLYNERRRTISHQLIKLPRISRLTYAWVHYRHFPWRNCELAFIVSCYTQCVLDFRERRIIAKIAFPS